VGIAPGAGPVALRAARPGDLPAIRALLEAAGLPSAGVAEHLGTFVVVESQGALVGVGGLEIHGPVGLLRSLAMAPAQRRRGLASAICAHLEGEARARGLEALYLLTETATAFFARRGYRPVPRAAAPAAIAACAEFRVLCPRSAALMGRVL